jgi:hypothetical protein
MTVRDLLTTLSSSSACSTAFVACASGLSHRIHFAAHGLRINRINDDDYKNILRASLGPSCGATYYRRHLKDVGSIVGDVFGIVGDILGVGIDIADVIDSAAETMATN